MPYLGGQGWVLQSCRSCGGRRELTHSPWSAASLVCLFRQITTASCKPGIRPPRSRWPNKSYYAGFIKKAFSSFKSDYRYPNARRPICSYDESQECKHILFLLSITRSHIITFTRTWSTEYCKQTLCWSSPDIRPHNESKQRLYLMGHGEYQNSTTAPLHWTVDKLRGCDGRSC